jgi:phenylalanyl-tRNA synthetase beta chain
MPKIDVSKGDLESLIGKNFSEEELESALMFAKGELDEADGDNIKVDIKDTNRPDLWSVEGMAREIKHHLGNPDFFEAEDSKVVVFAEPELKDIRPYISCCFVKGISFSDGMIKDLMGLQERLHAQIGRNREKVAIGISDFGQICPDISYKLATNDLKFPPLGHTELMSPKEILDKHEKGIEYKGLVKKGIPILVDSKNQVISMPPIINSNTLGRIDENVKDVFIDVTGTDKKLVDLTLLVLAMNFQERGGKVYRVKIKDFEGERMSPDLSEVVAQASLSECSEICGLELDAKTIIGLLSRSGARAEANGDTIIARYPAHRKDVFGSRDIIEDILISYGYNNLTSQKPNIATQGGESRSERLMGVVEDIMVGCGFQQAISFALTNEETENAKMRLEGSLCRITNPMNKNYTAVRRSLLPCLMDFLSKNRHNEFPQRVFEAGRVADGAGCEKFSVSAIISNSAVNYEEISSILEALIANLGFNLSLERADDPRFILGRCAKAIVDGVERGIVGEIHPEVIQNFGLEAPVLGFEVELGFLIG